MSTSVPNAKEITIIVVVVRPGMYRIKIIGQQKVYNANIAVAVLVPGNNTFTNNTTLNREAGTIIPMPRDARKSFIRYILA